ncbi:hypothetical protein [Virgibacillus ndiopensis]|nr:hypothetical protein [Virgibacillus ndiopensis]
MRKLRIVVILSTMTLLFFPYMSTVADDAYILHYNQDPGLGNID